MSKKIITTPFDRDMTPPRQNPLFMPFIWLGAYLSAKPHGLKINKIDMEGLKPPFIVLGNHQAFTDFLVTPLALFPYRANYISELEGFENYGGRFYRQLGALGTRKFINDMSLIKNIQKVVKRGDIIVIYPEARYCNAGTSAIIPDSVGKLCKLLRVPVVTLNMRGNYLRSPIWNTAVRKQARLSATIQRLYTAEQLKALSSDEINEGIRGALDFNEYRYQLDNKISITYPKRAEGLEAVLYQCPVCHHEFTMVTNGAALSCTHCNNSWKMDEYGRLVARDNADFGLEHIPDWYEWQRERVIEQIDKDEYQFEGSVHIEALPNEYNFIDLGDGYLKHTRDGFYLSLIDYGETEERTLFFSSGSCLSIHTEYNYRNKGPCVTLSTLDNTYFIYPKCSGFNPTKLQFATEYLYELAVKK
jgi:hypothetical protein